jgi:hypothetical protein
MGVAPGSHVCDTYAAKRSFHGRALFLRTIESFSLHTPLSKFLEQCVRRRQNTLVCTLLAQCSCHLVQGSAQIAFLFTQIPWTVEIVASTLTRYKTTQNTLITPSKLTRGTKQETIKLFAIAQVAIVMLGCFFRPSWKHGVRIVSTKRCFSKKFP